MSAGFAVTYVFLWVIVLLLVVAVLVLARQVGILNMRVPATGAATTFGGPAIGDPAPQLTALSLAGNEIRIGSSGKGSQLLFFLSPACGACERLAPAIRSVVRSQSPMLETIVITSHENSEDARKFAERTHLEKLPVAPSHELTEGFDIRGTPYAIYLDEEGVVRAKGVVNSLEQIEGLIEAGRQRLTIDDLTPGPQLKEPLVPVEIDGPVPAPSVDLRR